VSRAFVGEDSNASADDEAPELKVPIPPGSRNYLTPEGAAALADGLRRLELEERPALAREVERLSKDPGARDALSAARRALARADRRLEYLSRMAALAEAVEPPPSGYDRVRFGATVVVTDSGGRMRRYRIVGVDEASPDRGSIGWTSPVARALMGRKPGDRVTARLPAGDEEFTVVSVE